MNCDDVRHAIYVFLDDELASDDRLDFELHLQDCDRCRCLAHGEERFLEDLREQLHAPPAPEDLKTRIETLLAEQPAPLPREAETTVRSRWRWAMPVVASAAAAVVVWYVGTTTNQNAVPVVQEAVAAHQNDLPMEVRGSKEHVQQFLQRNVRFAVHPPLAEGEDLQLVGARLQQLGGQSAVLFNYEYQGKRLSVLQLAQLANEPVEPAEPRIEQHAGYRVVTFRNGGVTNSVVGAVPAAAFGRLVPASYRR